MPSNRKPASRQPHRCPAPSRWRIHRRLPACCCASSLLLLLSPALHAQEALQNLVAGDAARDQRREQVASQAYTIKSGDFRLLATPSLGVDFNDNIRNSDASQKSDVIVRPMLNLAATYPLTQYNLLTLNLGLGYDWYLDHDDLSGLRLQSGSALSFDMFIKDFVFNLHDRVSYARDSAQQSYVADTGDFGNFQNTAGLSATWMMSKGSVMLGYDHQTIISGKSAFRSQDRASEMLSSRASFVVHPQIQAGVEATVSLTSYDQPTLNDNTGYSAGLFADWQPGTALHLTGRGGYAIYQFESSALAIRTEDLDSYYFDLTARHDLSDAFSYGLSFGHDVQMGGDNADAVERTYVRPTLIWRALKHASINFGFSYEHGQQGAGNLAGSPGRDEDFDWFGGTLSTGWQITEKVNLALNYRLTLRSSDQTARSYTQNMVGLLLTYRPQ
jgi:hypothetical protein